MKKIIAFIKEEDGISTVEIVFIMAILIGLALLFRRTIMGYAAKLLGQILGRDPQIDAIESTIVN